MANKNTIAIELVVNDNGSVTIKQFGQNAEHAMNQASNAGDALSGVMNVLAKKLAAAFAVKELIEFTKESILLSARVQTLGVVLGVVGENSGYSKGQMEGYGESVKKMGITTEAANDAVIKIAQAQINAADSFKLARIAQDAAVIGNINSSEAFTRMINGIRSGEVEILKTIGLNVNFEQGYVKMAQTLGKARDALTEQEKAQARANVVVEAGERITGSYEAAMGTAGKMIQSLTRLVDELKLGYGQLFSGGLTDAVGGVTYLLKDMNAYMEKMRASGAITEISDQVATGLKIAWITVKDVIEAVWTAIKPLAPIIELTLPVLALVATGWGYILSLIKPVGVVIGEVIQSVFNLGQMAGSVFGMIGSALLGQWDMVGKYRDQFNTAYESIAASGAKTYTALTTGVVNAMMEHDKSLKNAITVTEKLSATEIEDMEKGSQYRARISKQIIAETAGKEAAEKAAAEAKKKSDAEAKADLKAMLEDTRKTSAEILGIGETQFEKDMARIDSEYAKHVKVSKNVVASRQWREVQIEQAVKKQTEATIKMEGKNADDLAKSWKTYEDNRDKDKKEAEEADKKYLAAKKAATEKIIGYMENEYDFAATENERAINKIIKDAEKKVKEIEKLVNKEKGDARAGAEAIELINRNKNSAILERETENARKISTMNYNLIKDIRGWEEPAYKARILEIQAEGQKMIDMGADVDSVMAKMEQDTYEAHRKMKLASGGFFDGMTIGLNDMKRNTKSAAEYGLEMFTTFATSSKTAVSDVLFQSITTGTVDFKAVWKTFSEGLVRKFTDSIAEMAMQNIAAALTPSTNQAKGLFDSLWTSVKGGYDSLITWLGDKDISGGIGDSWDDLKSFITGDDGIFGGISSGYDSILGDMSEVDVSGALATSWDSFEGMFTGGDGIWDSVKSGYDALIGDIGSTDLVGAVQGGWDSFKGLFSSGFGEISGDWVSEIGTWAGSLTDTIGDLASAAANSDIVLSFEAAWTTASETVSKIISGAINLWNWMSEADGGLIPGSARVSGDSRMNDTVPVLASPGEYFMPRTAVTPETLPVLEYMRANKGLPGYADGGEVRPAYPYLAAWGEHPSHLGEDPKMVAMWTARDYRYPPMRFFYSDPESDQLLLPWAESYWSMMAGHEGGSPDDEKWKNLWNQGFGQADLLGTLKKRDGQIRSFYQEGTYDDEYPSRGTSWMVDFLGQLTKWVATIGITAAATYVSGGLLGPYVGSAMGMGIGAAGATYVLTQGNWQAAIIAGILAALASGINEYFGTTDSSPYLDDGEFEGWRNSANYVDALESNIGGGSIAKWWANIQDNFTKYAAKGILKGAVKIGAGKGGVDGSDQGHATFSFAGSNERGLFEILEPLMGDIAPTSSPISLNILGGGYPAMNGLAYVPYDDFPIRAHEGEAVLTKEDADDWRGGSTRGGVTINGPLIHIEGNLIAGEKEFNNFARKIERQLDKFASKRIDVRGN